LDNWEKNPKLSKGIYTFFFGVSRGGLDEGKEVQKGNRLQVGKKCLLKRKGYKSRGVLWWDALDRRRGGQRERDLGVRSWKVKQKPALVKEWEAPCLKIYSPFPRRSDDDRDTSLIGYQDILEEGGNRSNSRKKESEATNRSLSVDLKLQPYTPRILWKERKGARERITVKAV